MDEQRVPFPKAVRQFPNFTSGEPNSLAPVQQDHSMVWTGRGTVWLEIALSQCYLLATLLLRHPISPWTCGRSLMRT